MPVDHLPRSVRLGRAVALLLGAALYALLVPDPLGFVWTPLLLGAAYLAAAVPGARDGGLWATAAVLIGFGLGAVAHGELGIGVDAGAAYVTGVGLGLVACALLERAGFAADLLSAGAVVLAAGLLFALAGETELFADPWLYVALLALVGAANAVLALRAPVRGGRRPGGRH